MSTAMMFMAVCMNLSLIILSLIWDLLPIGYLDKNEKFKNKFIFSIAYHDNFRYIMFKRTSKSTKKSA